MPPSHAASLSQTDDSATLRWVTRAFFLAASAAWPFSTVPQVTAWAMQPNAAYSCLAAWVAWALLSAAGCPAARPLRAATAGALLLLQGLALGLALGLGAVIMVANNGGLLLYVLTASFGALSVLVEKRGGGDPPRRLAMAFLLFGGAFVWLASRLGPMGTMRPSMVCAMASALVIAAVRLAAARPPHHRHASITPIQAGRPGYEAQACRRALALLCGCSLLHGPTAAEPVMQPGGAQSVSNRRPSAAMYARHVLASLAFIAMCYGIGHAVRIWDGYQRPSATNVFEPARFVPPKSQALRNTLTQEQYSCTQQGGTEAPFTNAYWNNHRAGIYVDIVSGEPLFSSLDKYDSKTGWPSFSKPFSDDAVQTQKTPMGDGRTEIHSKYAHSHLGHLFDDGPGPKGLRFCVNSAALRFVPLDELKAQGLSHLLFGFAQSEHWDIATLAGGCFWGSEHMLESMPGVIETQVGYTGGRLNDADYDAVSTGQTGHAEAVQILYDPKVLSYETILTFFFKMHDPTTQDRQGNDVGTQYRSAIFYNSPEQKAAALKLMAKVEHSNAWKKPLTTQLLPLGPFWRAEEHHQKYLQKNPLGYSCHQMHNLSFE